MPNHETGYKKIYMRAFSGNIEEVIFWESPWEVIELATRTTPESIGKDSPHGVTELSESF